MHFSAIFIIFHCFTELMLQTLYHCLGTSQHLGNMLEWWLHPVYKVKLISVVKIAVVDGDLGLLNYLVEGLEVYHVV